MTKINWPKIIYGLLLAFSFTWIGGVIVYYGKVVPMQRDKEQQEASFAIAAGEAVAYSQNKILQLEEQHGIDDNKLAVIHAGMVSSPKLPSAIAKNCEHSKAGGDGNADEASRLLLAETERILEADRQRTAGIESEAESDISSCRVMQGYIKSLP